MQILPVGLLFLAFLQYLVAHFLFLKYNKSILHRYYIFAFSLLATLYLAFYFLAVSSSEKQVWIWIRVLSFSHFYIPIVTDSILYILRDRLRPRTSLKNLILYGPYLVIFLIDFIKPQWSIKGVEPTRYGQVFVYLKESNVLILQNIVNIPTLLFFVGITMYAYIKEINKIKRRFFVFLFFSLILPLICFVVFTYWVPNGKYYIIPLLAFVGFTTMLTVGYSLYKYSIFDISLEIAWKDILSNMPNMVFLLDSQFNIVETNNSVTQQLYYNPNELTNKPFYSLLHEPNLVLNEEYILSISGSEVFIKTNKQSYISAILYISQVHRRGHFLGYMVIGNDVTNLHKLSDEKKMLQLELNALQVQMNPHFIFNSINSIFYLINKEKLADANKYLSDLAHLMRSVMESVGVPSISVEEEIRILTMYLEIESLRFEKGFKFEILKSGKSNVSLRKIPPMIIQPFVENAIWHGLLSKPGNDEKILSLEFENQQSSLKVTITDNGVGWGNNELEKPLRTNKTKSNAIENIKERIRLYNSYSENQLISMNIADRVQSEDNITGTKVELVFKYKKEENDLQSRNN